MAIITKHKCDRCGTMFDDPIPSTTTMCVTPDLYIQVSVRHNHCAYDMCERCRLGLIKAHVKVRP